MKSMNKNIKTTLLKTTNSIKKKYKEFNKTKQLNQENLKEFYKPVIESINSLHSNSKDSSLNSNKKNHGTQKNKSPLDFVSSTPKPTKKSVFFRSPNDSFKSDEYSDENDEEFDYEDQSEKESALIDNNSGQKKVKGISTDDHASDNITLDETVANSPHVKHYLSSVRKINSPKYDTIYGVRKNGSDYKIGDANVEFDSGGDMVIKNKKYAYTKGLYDLLFYAKPPPGYTKDDLAQYKKILNDTNAHKKNYEYGSTIRSNNSYKYSKIIKPLIYKKSGNGLLDYLKLDDENSSNYTYWDDPNELVNRLRLLISSKSAGHTGHENEIISIIEELREAKIIY